MAASKPAVTATVVGLLGCAALGAYGTYGAASKNGFFEAISRSVGVDVAEPYFPGGRTPQRFAYTGFWPIDIPLRFLISFFSAAIDPPQTWDVTLSSVYLMVQFCAGWSLLALESMRRGNAGKAISWAVIVGLLVQTVSYTITVPLFLILHLLTSPLTTVTPANTNWIAIDAMDSMIFPLTTIMAYWGPAIMMALPGPQVGPQAHYSWCAVWQFFPLTQDLYRGILKYVVPQDYPAGMIQSNKLNRQALGYVYSFIMFISVVSHLSLVAAALAPASLVPAQYSAYSHIIDQVDIVSAFVPYWPSNSPTIDPFAKPITGEGMAELARSFLQYDIYCGGAAILIWAIYMNRAAIPGKSVASLLPKITFWTLLGGFPAAAASLIWGRDAAVLVDAKDKEKKDN